MHFKKQTGMHDMGKIDLEQLGDVFAGVSATDRNVQKKYNEEKAKHPYQADKEYLEKKIELFTSIIQQCEAAANDDSNSKATRVRQAAYANAYVALKGEYQGYLDILKAGGTPKVVNLTDLPNIGNGSIDIFSIIQSVKDLGIFPTGGSGNGSGSSGSNGTGANGNPNIPPGENTQANMGNTIIWLGLAAAGLALISNGRK